MPHEIGTRREPMMYLGSRVVTVNWFKILDSWIEYVPMTKAKRKSFKKEIKRLRKRFFEPTSDRGPNTAEGIFAPTPRTEEGGAAPSQKEGPGLPTAIRGAAFTLAPRMIPSF